MRAGPQQGAGYLGLYADAARPVRLQGAHHLEELLALPGVGRKSANLIMGDVFGMPAIVTDTHCIRLCNKIGLVDGIKEPQKVEMALWKIIPPEEGSDLCHRFVMHGRAVCNARKPECERCCLKDVCRYAAEQAAAQTK